ncbi:MAG: hypothetical protein ABSB42_10945 [Tepidisphaeraceae bacterium]|jgi:hypothetical protein
MGNHSQIVHCTGMSRVAGEDLPVKLLCLRQPPAPMVPHCRIEGLLDRDLGQERSNLILPV